MYLLTITQGFKIFIIALLLYATTPTKSCSISKDIFYSILMNEGLKNRIGYEYIISFNKDTDAKLLKNTVIKDLFINSRTLDCKNKKLCTYILYKLTKSNITNIDLGAFQINYDMNKLNSLADYFDIDKSYLFACDYIEKCVAQYGNNFKAYSCYHSKTPKYNEKYQKSLKLNYKKVQNFLKKD